MAESARKRVDPLSMRDLSDIQLMRRIERFDTKERELTLYILHHLGELDRRRLYLRQGYNSLFDFCIRHLNYSEAAAGRRIRAARTIRDYPEVAARYEAREVSVTTISRIAGIITKKNCSRLLDAVAGRRKNDVEMIVSRFRPRERIIEKVKPVFVLTAVPEDSAEDIVIPGARSNAPTSLDTSAFSEGGRSSTAAGGGKIPSTFPGHAIDAESAPDRAVTGGQGRIDGESGPEMSCRKIMTQRLKYRLEFGIDPDLMQKIERVKKLLSTKYPGNVSLEQLLAELINEYLERHSPEARKARRERRSSLKSGPLEKKPGAVGKKVAPAGKQTCPAGEQTCPAGEQTRKVSPGETGRHIPRHLRDEIYSRDGGRCSYIGPDGTRCGSDWNVQIDHIRPFSKGGDHSPENLRLLCAKHNRFEAEKQIGITVMKKFRKRE